MEDESEKAASTAIIHNFGQTPLQIFKTPHPHRFLSGRSTLPVNMRFGVAEQWQLLFRSILPICETSAPIDDIVEPLNSEGRPTPQQRHRLIVPGTLLSVQFGFADDSLRVYYQDTATRVSDEIQINCLLARTPVIACTPDRGYFNHPCHLRASNVTGHRLDSGGSYCVAFLH